MNTKNLISRFIAQICEKQYAYANSTLSTILEKKLKDRIKKAMEEKIKPGKKKSARSGSNKKIPKMTPKKNK